MWRKSMDYKIFIDGKAEKELSKLQSDLQKKIILSILRLKNNPRPFGIRKLSGLKSCYRLRIGDYRAIYEIDDEKKLINILIIRHRKDAYK